MALIGRLLGRLEKEQITDKEIDEFLKHYPDGQTRHKGDYYYIYGKDDTMYSNKRKPVLKPALKQDPVQ
jgi:hypothetical protein